MPRPVKMKNIHMDTRIKRVKKAIQQFPGTSVPKGELVLEPGFARKFLEWKQGHPPGGVLSNAEVVMACCRQLSLDLVCLQSEPHLNTDPEGTLNLDDINLIAKNDFFVFWIVNGAFQSLMNLQGMMSLFTDISQSPDKVQKALQRASAKVTVTMEEGVHAGAHGIILADDIAYNQGTYISPGFVHQYLVPLWKHQVDCAKKMGVPIFFHSDGNLNTVLPDIVTAGFDGLQCMEPTAGMDLLSIKNQYGKKLCLMGNVDPTLLSSPDDMGPETSLDSTLEKTVNTLMTTARTNCGVIFGTCCGLHEGMSFKKVDFMYRFASRLG